MSVSTEVQRTLVKSPPELWSELSNPEALARHLSELGEIRITSIEPETQVEWESEGASGVVQLKQSGWGTRVTLSVTRGAPAGEAEPEAVAAPEAVAEAEPEAVATPETVAKAEPEAVATPEAVAVAEVEPEAVAEPETVAVAEAEPQAVAEPETVAAPEPEADVEPEPEPAIEPEPIAAIEPEPKLGFFAKLFRRRRANTAKAVEPEVEIVAMAGPEPIYPEPEPELEPVEPAADLAAELASVEAQMTAETTELLTGVLDRLGAAHHRPFSRG